MAKLRTCRRIGGQNIKRNDELRAMVIDNEQLVLFTPMEYRLMTPLLEHEIVTDEQLIQALFTVNLVDQHILKNLEKHVENAKRKLRQTGLSLRRIHRYGYSLVAERGNNASSATSLPGWP